jgi:hypothetical protein
VPLLALLDGAAHTSLVPAGWIWHPAAQISLDAGGWPPAGQW